MLWVIDTVRERGSVEPPRLNDPDCKNATTKGGESACGAADGDRTHDPWLRRPILYPLSYSRGVRRTGEAQGYRVSVGQSTRTRLV